jgi:uncharacterized protein (DUF1800 family)
MEKYTGTWGRDQVTHLLKRTMFGSTKKDVDYFLTRTLDQAIDELINPTAPLPPPPVKTYSDPLDDAIIPMGQTWVNSVIQNNDIYNKRLDTLRPWWIGVLVNQDRSVREKMTLFWNTHFTAAIGVIHNPTFAYKYIDLLRRNSLGNFKTFARDISIDGGMLGYLNGYLSSKAAPDENYARELQELFTLGKENNPNYTEDDVKQAARLLTGWRQNPTTGTVYFDANDHDTGDKQFSSFYNNTVIKGGTDGMAELNALIDMIFNKKQEVATFIVKRLYKYFVYYNIDSTIELNVIQPLAQTLINNNWEIKPVLRELFTSAHFYSPEVQACIIKSPLELCIGYLREFNAVSYMNMSVDTLRKYEKYIEVHVETRGMGQTIGDPPDVSGWKAYYQKPMFNRIWISSDTVTKRNVYSDSYINFENINIIEYTKSLPNPSDPNRLIIDFLSTAYRYPMSQEFINKTKTDILLIGQTNDYYWTNAWTNYIANPTNTLAYNTVYEKLKSLYKYLTTLPQYQLM